MGEIVISSMLIILSIFLLTQTFAFWNHGADLGGIGPGWWPFCLLVIILVAAAILLYSAFKKNPRSFSTLKVGLNHKVLKTILLFIAYVFMIDVVGFLVATPIFLIIFMWMLSTDKIWLKIGAISLVTTFFFVYVFGKIMYIPLPRGSVEIFKLWSKIFY